MSIIVPSEYQSKLTLFETQQAIKVIKDVFQLQLEKYLHLIRVSAPLFVETKTGLNDNLNGFESPVAFELKHSKQKVEIVQSLAKWKRMALQKYQIPLGKGIYTDMNAIRPDERTDNLHSIYVDQWDWEQVIEEKDRHLSYLYQTVQLIVNAVVETKTIVQKQFSQLKNQLTQEVFFITSEELRKRYPHCSASEREYHICQEKKTVFIAQIGRQLSDGTVHDHRAPDYDDWELNGDILFWHPVLHDAVELSSMGIRVNKASLASQLQIAQATDRYQYEYHQAVRDQLYPLTIGGGIGQSRLCMLLLEKCHIAEVQASVWTAEDVQSMIENKILYL